MLEAAAQAQIRAGGSPASAMATRSNGAAARVGSGGGGERERGGQRRRSELWWLATSLTTGTAPVVQNVYICE